MRCANYLPFDAYKNTKMIRYTLLSLLLVMTSALLAQQTPAPPQKQAIMITGATAHLGNGQRIENSIITFENGKITTVGDSRSNQPAPGKNFRIIDATGKHLYPGFIAPSTNLGITEIDAVRATRDFREVGNINPNVRALVAYNTDSRVSPTVRSNGILLIQVTPQGGWFSGQSSVVQLDAWNWEDAVVKADDGVHLNWPRYFGRSGWWANPGTISKNKDYDQHRREIESFLLEAQAYLRSEPSMPNLKFEAMRGVLEGDRKLYVHADGLKEMTNVIDLCDRLEITPVIVGGRDAWRMADVLKEKSIPVILRKVQSLPGREDNDIDQPFKTARLLHEAGVDFCFSMGGAWEQRNLSFQAGQAVAYGLDKEAAIAALSGNTARIMGIDDRTGSLEVGKAATLFISAGDALDMRTCKVEQAFIDGREIDLDNKQKALSRKFRKKYADPER